MYTILIKSSIFCSSGCDVRPPSREKVPATPVTMQCGFLGRGKTTIPRHLVLLSLARMALTLCASGGPAALPPSSARETGVRLVIDSLYGGESSRRAVARADVSSQESQRRFESARFKELTYGEFDLDFFFALLRDARPSPGERFVDVGSGCGRLVAAAALLHAWESASGIEVLNDLHTLGARSMARLKETLRDGAGAQMGVTLAPCTLRLGEADALLPHVLSSRTSSGLPAPPAVVFVYATCWPSVGPYLGSLSRTLAASLASGSRVITVDKQLVSEPGEWRFELLRSREMPNYNTHASAGYVYRLEAGGRVGGQWSESVGRVST